MKTITKKKSARKKHRAGLGRPRVLLGRVGVDSGQLMVCDPCYIDNQWDKEEFSSIKVYVDQMNGTQWCRVWDCALPDGTTGFDRYGDPIAAYQDKSANDLIASGRWVEKKETNPVAGNFSYNGACHTTMRHPAHGGTLGADTAVAFSSGYGDGCYPVYATYNKDGRVAKVEIVMIDE
jgi:hypothetical protein